MLPSLDSRALHYRGMQGFLLLSLAVDLATGKVLAAAVMNLTVQ